MENFVVGVTGTLPIASALVVALGAFAAWVAVLIREDRGGQRVEARGLVVAHSTPTRRDVVPVSVAPRSGPQLVVRAGSFCTRPGSTATTAIGTTMVCSTIGASRPRWRRAHLPVPIPIPLERSA